MAQMLVIRLLYEMTIYNQALSDKEITQLAELNKISSSFFCVHLN